jgi:hypothetical protein
VNAYEKIKREKLGDGLRDSVLRLSPEQLKATAGLAPGYGGVRFCIPEDDLEMLGLPGSINAETASDIFNLGIRQICRHMLESGSALSEEIVASACEKIVEEMQASEGEHLFITFVPSMILATDESIKIGGGTLRKATSADASLLEGRASAFLERMGDNQGPRDKEDFLKRYLGSSLVEIRFSGCHFRDEVSIPCDAAWKEYRRIAAFLAVCKKLLELPEAHADRGLDPTQWPWDAFMVGKHGGAPLIPIYTHGWRYSIDGLDFAIDPPVLEQLKKLCHLDAFNRLCKTEGELRNKVHRSLDWFLKAFCENDPTDQLVCLFISFESLMAMGSDALHSQTDDLAENIALLIRQSLPQRIEEKSFFKKRVYPLRNRVMHHGHTFEPKDVQVSSRLMVYITYGLIGILKHLDAIKQAGGPRSFFEQVKMRAVI